MPQGKQNAPSSGTHPYTSPPNPVILNLATLASESNVVSVEITSAPDSTRNIVASRSNSIDIIGNVATADSEVAAGLNRTMLATILVVKLAWEMGKTYLIAKEYAATVRAAHTSTRGRSINAAPCSVKPHEVGHSVNTVVP
jgi:hypothetical protein